MTTDHTSPPNPSGRTSFHTHPLLLRPETCCKVKNALEMHKSSGRWKDKDGERRDAAWCRSLISCLFQRGRRLKVCLCSKITRCLPAFCHTSHISCVFGGNNTLEAPVKCLPESYMSKRNSWKVKIKLWLELNMAQIWFLGLWKILWLHSQTKRSRLPSALCSALWSQRWGWLTSVSYREMNMKQKHWCISERLLTSVILLPGSGSGSCFLFF